LVIILYTRHSRRQIAIQLNSCRYAHLAQKHFIKFQADIKDKIYLDGDVKKGT